MSESTTTDPLDPRLGRGVDSTPRGQNEAYLVLTEEERALGFRRPLRESYKHVRSVAPNVQACGSVTTMSLPIAETYARDPKFYGSTYCVACRMHRPVAEFDWTDGSGSVGE